MEMGEEGKERNPKTGPMVDIYIQVHGGKSDEEDSWIKLSKSSYWEKYTEVAVPPLPESIEYPVFVSLGSKIYASGGFTRSPETRGPMMLPIFLPSNKVFYFDTRHPEDGWEAVAPMKKKRMQHYVLADAGKIYVLGSHDVLHPLESADKKRLFAEVYDPNYDTWEELAYIGDDIDLDSLPLPIYGHAVVDHGLLGRKILFHSYHSQSLFYLNTRHKGYVDVYDDTFGRLRYSSAFLDGVLYFFGRKGMYACDVSSDGLKFKRVDLRNVMKNTLPRVCFGDESIPYGSLLSLGNGHLALIWHTTPEFVVPFNLHCSILEMVKKGDSIVGVVLNCSSHTVRKGSIGVHLAVSSEMDVGEDAEPGHRTQSSNKQHKS